MLGVVTADLGAGPLSMVNLWSGNIGQRGTATRRAAEAPCVARWATVPPFGARETSAGSPRTCAPFPGPLISPLNLKSDRSRARAQTLRAARDPAREKMPKRTDIGSILIIGAGPIVIGQAW